MDPNTPADSHQLLAAMRRVHHEVRRHVVAACESHTLAELCGEAVSAAGDVTYAIDRIAEEALLAAIEGEVTPIAPIVLVCEGIENGELALPVGISADEARWRVIVDPIDGTRGLMVQKRSAWILTGIAPNRGSATTLNDIELALQTELPLVKQHLCDELWAAKECGAHGQRWNRLDGDSQPLEIKPSRANDLVHGYGTVCSFFAGGRDVLGTIADELSRRLLGTHHEGEARIFEDQYACTGGQIAGLILGQDRFVADLRPLLARVMSQRKDPMGHCCHPYDLCTKLIAEEAGVEICDPRGDTIDVPLDTETNVAWVGYANRELRIALEPVLQELIAECL